MDTRMAQLVSDLSDVEAKIHSLGKDWLWFFGRCELSDQEKAAWSGLPESLGCIRKCKDLIKDKSKPQEAFKNIEGS